jgi:hypothetical protein
MIFIPNASIKDCATEKPMYHVSEVVEAEAETLHLALLMENLSLVTSKHQEEIVTNSR